MHRRECAWQGNSDRRRLTLRRQDLIEHFSRSGPMPAEGLFRFAFPTWLVFTMVGWGLAPLAGSEIERPNFSK
jgi:hypothetical protein